MQQTNTSARIITGMLGAAAASLGRFLEWETSCFGCHKTWGKLGNLGVALPGSRESGVPTARCSDSSSPTVRPFDL